MPKSHPSTISRELARYKVLRGYRSRQAERLSDVRSGSSRDATRIDPEVWVATKSSLLLQHSPEQIVACLQLSHEVLCQRVYADKCRGSDLWRHLRCQKMFAPRLHADL